MPHRKVLDAGISDSESIDDEKLAAAEAALSRNMATRLTALSAEAKKRRAALVAASSHPELAVMHHGRGLQAALAFMENATDASARRVKEKAAEARREGTPRTARKRLEASQLDALFADPTPPPPLEAFVEHSAARAEPAGSPRPPAFGHILPDTPLREGLRALDAAVASLKKRAGAEGARLVVERGVRPEDELHERGAKQPGTAADSPRMSFYKRAAEKIAADLAALKEAGAAVEAAAAKTGGASPFLREPWRPASRSPSPAPGAAGGAGAPSRSPSPSPSLPPRAGPGSRAATPTATERHPSPRPASRGAEGAGGSGKQRPLTSSGGGGGGGGGASGSGSPRAGPRYWPSDAPLDSAFPSPPRDRAFDAEFSSLLREHITARASFKVAVLKQDYSPQKLVDGHVE